MRTVNERRVLGRGLGALLPSPGSGADHADYIECPLDRIAVADHQPRQRFSEEKLRELAESIRAKGVLQPVVVRRDGDRFLLIAGERRVRAARLAGLRAVPVVVKDVSPSEVFELALIENIQREDLDPIEEAEAYARLIESHGYTHDELARRVGKERTTVVNSLRLLQLDANAKEMVAEGRLSAGHARALLGVAEEEARRTLQTAILTEGLSVRETERRVRVSRPPAAPPAPQRRSAREQPLSPLHEIVAREIGAHVEAPVRVMPTSRRAGRVVIEYESLEALQRIHERITGREPG